MSISSISSLWNPNLNGSSAGSASQSPDLVQFLQQLTASSGGITSTSSASAVSSTSGVNATSGDQIDLSQLEQTGATSSSPYGSGQVDTQKFLANFSKDFGADAASDVTNSDGSIDFGKVAGYIEAKLQTMQSSNQAASTTTTDATTAVASDDTDDDSTTAASATQVKGHHGGGGHHHHKVSSSDSDSLLDATDSTDDADAATDIFGTTSTTTASATTGSTDSSTSSQLSQYGSLLATMFGGPAAGVAASPLLDIVA